MASLIICFTEIVSLPDTEMAALQNYQDCIYQNLAEVFRKYFQTIYVNNGYQNINSLGDVIQLAKQEKCFYLDDVTSKVEAWKSCLHLVKQILHIDLEIITGVGENIFCYL